MVARPVFHTCPLCEATCGLELSVEGASITRIRGDRDDVFSRGYVCPKGATLASLHTDPDRLRRPLLRRRAADGTRRPAASRDDWIEVDWREAWHVVEEGLAEVRAQSGSQALGIYLGNPTVHSLAGAFCGRSLIQALGTRHVYSASTLDQMPKHVASGFLYGRPDAIAVPDLDRTEHLLMLGANPLESNGSLCTAPDFPGRLRRLRERGGRLVVVDPRRTRTAKIASEHVSILPGGDALLLCAMLQTLCAEDRVRIGRLEAECHGLEGLADVLASFVPERVAANCGVDAATIRRLARELAEAPTAAVYGRIGTHTVPYGTIAAWAVDLLNLLTGNLDRPGGAMFARPAHSSAERRRGGRGFRTGRWHSRLHGLPEVRGEFPVAVLADEILADGEGQLRGLVTVGGNPVLSAPGSERLDAALADLDFMVSVDPYCNETTRHADVILPPPSPLQRSHYDFAFYSMAVRNVANFSEPVFPADGPSELEILARLTQIARDGHADWSRSPAEVAEAAVLTPWIESAVRKPHSPLFGRVPEHVRKELDGADAAECLLDAMIRLGPYGDGFGAKPDGLGLRKLRAAPHGIDLGALTPQLPEYLATPSGKIEVLADPIRTELGRLAESLDRGEPRASQARLRLIGRRNVRSNNSWMHNLPALVSGRDRCTLQIHPEDAAALGLETGHRALIASRAGEVVAPVEVTDEIRPGVVSLPHGFGHDVAGTRLEVARSHAGVNVNRVTDPRVLDALSGTVVLNGVPVKVERACVD